MLAIAKPAAASRETATSHVTDRRTCTSFQPDERDTARVAQKGPFQTAAGAFLTCPYRHLHGSYNRAAQRVPHRRDCVYRPPKRLENKHVRRADRPGHVSVPPA